MTICISRALTSFGRDTHNGQSAVEHVFQPPLTSFARDTHDPIHRRPSAPFSPQTLTPLTVSRRLGYGGVATARSQPLQRFSGN